MECLNCKHKNEIYAFLDPAVNRYGIERWNQIETTFRCPDCQTDFSKGDDRLTLLGLQLDFLDLKTVREVMKVLDWIANDNAYNHDGLRIEAVIERLIHRVQESLDKPRGLDSIFG